ncbi:MFS transporter [Brevibacillus fluminis]|uniref:MFS transporter n=1 Tax=Brevibacillus fluminis TaxID=511487 RepID=UPI003F8AD080
MSAALLGRYGGKWADRKGSLFVLFIGLLLMMLGQFALSIASGHVAWIVAACLVLVNVGMSFFQVSTTKVVSTTLPAGQTGVGLGIFSLTNFMAGAVSGAVISKMIDHTGTVSPFNPLAVPGAAAIYSNVYFGLIAVTALGAWIVYAVFGRKRAKRKRLSGGEAKAH